MPPVQPLTTTTPRPPGFEPDAQRPLRLLARDLQGEQLLHRHSHPWGQVTYALEGIVRVSAGNSSWIVPPLRAIWIPPDLAHELATMERTRLRVLYIDSASAPFAGPECKALEVSPLLRELIVALEENDGDDARPSMVRALILNELGRLTTLPICVPMPADKRLKQLCQMLIAAPASNRTLEQWALQAGASPRTLARLFERELGMSFSAWRQQMRLAHATPMITRGLSLSQVAAELGYANQSAFSAMFKKTFGQSPTAYFAPKAQ
jgi:AraC-like DNA-binding protein